MGAVNDAPAYTVLRVVRYLTEDAGRVADCAHIAPKEWLAPVLKCRPGPPADQRNRLADGLARRQPDRSTRIMLLPHLQEISALRVCKLGRRELWMFHGRP
jgi:hypothetical protein